MGAREDDSRGALRDGMGLRHGPVRLACLALVAAALVAGVSGGLARFGVEVGAASLAVPHAALMVSGFLGTVICLERAVAFGGGAAYAAPLAGACGTVALLAGAPRLSLLAWIAAPLLLMAVSAALVKRQPLPHMVLLAVAASAWALGNLLHAAGHAERAIAWWFAFLVLTIAAERLEMTRLMRRPPAAGRLFGAAVAALLGGAGLQLAAPAAGGMLFGMALVALAAWLFRFDLARRTRRQPGFAGYSARALLAGYAWLAVAGVAWIAVSLGAPVPRDIPLHALALGFVLSMVFGHAPLVVPAVAGRRMRFSVAFYVPLVLLHLSLAGRVAVDVWGDAVARRMAGTANVLALVVFAGVLAWSLRAGARTLAAPATHAAH